MQRSQSVVAYGSGGIVPGEYMKPFAEKFYKSNRWKRCRAGYYSYRQAIDGGMCEECHERVGEIVHHKIPLTPENINDPDIATGLGNMKLVCRICHAQEDHGYGDGLPEEAVRYHWSPTGEMIVDSPLKI